MSSSTRKKSTNINDKEEKKKIKVGVKSSTVDQEVKKKVASKVSESVLKRKPKEIENTTKVKVVPSTSRKIISNSIKVNNGVVQQRIKNESTPLKGNHQVNTSAQNLTARKKNPKEESKQSVSKQKSSRIVSSKSIVLNKDSTGKSGSTKVQTSVTINSPKHNRKELLINPSAENVVSPRNFSEQNSKLINSVTVKPLSHDLALNNHKRYRTRTLDPEEVMVIDKLVPTINYDVSESKLNANKKLIAQPKTFFVSLDAEEKPDVDKGKQSVAVVSNCDLGEPLESQDGDSLSYEDDFESYESDFESDNSTDGTHNSSSSDAKEVSSTSSSSLDLTHSDGQNKIKSDDEKKFDSGNYELGELQKSIESKTDKVLEKIIEINHNSNAKNELIPQTLSSLTDEGFDENSAGHSSSANNLSNETKMKVHKVVSIKKRISAQRAKDLKGLIVLDDVKYTLFEMFPMNYDTFIMIHGKSNMNQVTCQTNDDCIDQDVQTDSVSTHTKWTQNPIKFSKHPIVHKENDESNSKTNTKDNIEYSPLEIYLSQKLGCGSDSHFTHKNKKITDITYSTQRASFAKLTKFINKAGRVVLNFLNQRERLVDDKEVSLESKNTFTNENKSAHQSEDKIIYDIIKKYPLQNIYYTDTNTLLTVHSTVDPTAKTNAVYLNTLICIWLLRNGVLEPSKILSTTGAIKCCTISDTLSGLVVAGLSDGNISVWNLKEQDMWFKNLDSVNEISPTPTNDGPFRICSYHSGYDVCKPSGQKRHMWGSCVEVMFSKSTSRVDSSFGNISKNQQVYLLQEFGLLTTWIVVYKSPGYKNIADMDYYHTHWSTISLVKTNAVDLYNFLHSHLSDYNKGFTRRKVIKSVDNLMGSKVTESKRREKLNIEAKKGIARAFTDDSDIDFDDPDITERQENQPEDQNNFSSSDNHWENGIVCSIMKEYPSMKSILIACKSNEILNYSPSSIKKTTNVYRCEDEGSTVTCIETCPSNLPYFIVGCDSSNTIHLYAEKSTTPLRNFYLDHSDAHLKSYKQFTDKSYSVFNFANVDVAQKFGTSFWVDWVKTCPHMFFTFFRDGRIILFDLFNSDVLPKLYYNYGTNGTDDRGEHKFLLNGKVLPTMNHDHLSTNKFLMILHLSNGDVQFHKLIPENFAMKFKSKEEELDILKTYFELL